MQYCSNNDTSVRSAPEAS